jgi:hypothetical protein
MAGAPHRFLLSGWPLRCLWYVFGGAVVGIGLVLVLVAGILFPPAVVFLGRSSWTARGRRWPRRRWRCR